MTKNYGKPHPTQTLIRPVQQIELGLAPARPRRLNRRDAAAFLGVSVSWLDKARMTGRGPAFIAIGSRVVYDEGTLAAYLTLNTRTSTSP